MRTGWRRKLAARMPFELIYPVETNALFVRMDEAARKRLLELGCGVPPLRRQRPIHVLVGHDRGAVQELPRR